MDTFFTCPTRQINTGQDDRTNGSNCEMLKK